ncbi:tyrosine-type recombinase/integrase [Mycobacterium sp.]|uniref:tyrosine-type recombinase/integrase n=1 Tax=Mycobacterium sp. TaxID=1785 RepID=UPI003F9A0921
MAGKKGRRGWGKIRQLPSSKRFQASYIGPDTVRHKADHTFGTKIDAEGWLSNERRLIELDTWTPPALRKAERHAQAVSLGEYGAEWIAQRTTRGGEPLKPKSKAHYKSLLADYIKPLAKIPVKNLTPQAVRAWYAATLPDKPVMRAHAYGLLHAILATAVTDGLIPANPCQIERAMKAARKHEPVILDVDEVAKLADAIKPDRFRAFILIAAWCGLRRGEMFELRRKDIDKACQVITVARGVTHVGGCHIATPKSGKGRAVVVPPHIRGDVKQHMQTHVADDPEALLFPPARGGCHLNDKVFREYFNAALKSVGREGVHVHDLRHFCGTQTARVGNLVETMGRLGHSTVQASLTYQQIVSGRDAKIAEALSELAKGPR